MEKIAFKMKNQLYTLTNKYKVQRFIGEINTFRMFFFVNI